MKDKGNWHCLNIDCNDNCTVDCTNEPCIKVPWAPSLIEELRHELQAYQVLIERRKIQIEKMEHENDEALRHKI